MNSQEILEIIIKNYVIDKRGQAYTAKQAGISIRELKKLLTQNNIPIRGHAEATSISNKNRTLFKDEDYFKTQSSNMAWLLGFLASDGCISSQRNRIILNLSFTDREILEKIKEELKIENSIIDYENNKGFKCSELSWTSEKQVKDLAEYSITPKKTLILKPPYKLDKKYWIDYIRGYFDGDGSVNLIQNSNGRGAGNLRWQICSATKEIVEFVLNYFETELNIPKVAIQIRPDKNPLYIIQYSSIATRTIYNHLYTKNSLCLKRKKDHFDNIISQINSSLTY